MKQTERGGVPTQSGTERDPLSAASARLLARGGDGADRSEVERAEGASAVTAVSPRVHREFTMSPLLPASEPLTLPAARFRDVKRPSGSTLPVRDTLDFSH
ncbi:hypothetical protein AAFF_G00206580 [Aldrovandia affinis]|uniref:Uncharacterized protein n=1 Tax=Aldrovandia affinis TaxID=143900 RepID=A0AAD7RHD0_9TELE|nr:hypothetical protein AAFF_G00206580 [Aldrovandia affinis]